MIAAGKGNIESVKALITEYGLKDKHGLTALAYAILSKQDKVIKLLINVEGNIRIGGLTCL